MVWQTGYVQVMYTVSYVTVSLAFNTVQLLSFGACFFDFVEDRIHWID